MTVIEPATSVAESTRAPLTTVAVIIPAHNEQELLGACLDALGPAAWHARAAGLRVVTIVIANACTDATRATARARDVVCLTSNLRNVGAARAAGASHALSELAREGHDPAQVYLLHTDADTLVPADWITRHVQAATDHDAVLGPVEVRDWTQRSEDCAQRFVRASALEPDEDRVHGANLGMRADAYLRVGGFPALEVSEDRALVEALRTAGESVLFRGDLVVCTSARISRRVHGGFSDFLSKLEAQAENRPPSPAEACAETQAARAARAHTHGGTRRPQPGTTLEAAA